MINHFKVVISSRAQDDLAECVGFVLKASKEAAYTLARDIYALIEGLETFPEKNPLFAMPKSFPHPIRKQVINKRYIALYSTEGDYVVVYRVLDARRKFDGLVL